MKSLLVIPARLQSTRLPEKPLKDINGKSLIERVFIQASKVRSASKVVIATDNQVIIQHCRKFTDSVMLSPDTLFTGSDRVAFIANVLAEKGEHYDVVANVQGDMPFINPLIIERCITTLTEDASFDMSTIATPILSYEEFLKESHVKVVLGEKNRALYFSRSPIPFWRDAPADNAAATKNIRIWGHKHMGLYVFRPKILQAVTKLDQSEVEKKEKLEQLRALANGINIRVAIVTAEEVKPSIEVDTEFDLEQARKAALEFDKI